MPRPIAFISTQGPAGPNIAPFSFFVAGGPNPPSLAVCIVETKDGTKKTSLLNLEHLPEFVVNLVTREMAEGMNHTGVDYPKATSKWGLSGFTPIESQLVQPARIAESPAQFECRVHTIVPHGQSHYVIAEVLVAHIQESLIEKDTGKLTGFQPIARLGGAQYLDLACGKVFEMQRPGATPPSSLDL